MFEMFCANGGPYIKLGQMFGQLEQIMPQEYVIAFEPMCMRAPTTKFDDVRSIVESETGRKLEDIFSEFAEKPLASASLGQVHRARLRSTGEVVAVKVQHKWIKEQVPGDLNIIDLAVDIAKKLFPDFKYGWLAEEFRAKLPLEIDFKLEAKNCVRCAKMFEGNKYVKVPKVYEDLTTERMLTMSFETGTSVAHVNEMAKQGINLKKLAQLISETFVHMIFEEGFVHADPHPGNMFVRKIEGTDEAEIVLLDHGIYTELPKATRLAYNRLWRGILSQDEKMIKEASADLEVDFFQLFAAMVVDRKYEDIMDNKKQHNMKQRLGSVYGGKAQAEMQEYAMFYHKDIVDILDVMKRELLLVLKTNNYLKAIDKRLGNPNNTFNTINEVTWKVYKREIRPTLSTWQYLRESLRYYFLKLGLFAFYLSVRVRSALGYRVDIDELKDFELDYMADESGSTKSA